MSSAAVVFWALAFAGASDDGSAAPIVEPTVGHDPLDVDRGEDDAVAGEPAPIDDEGPPRAPVAAVTAPPVIDDEEPARAALAACTIVTVDAAARAAARACLADVIARFPESKAAAEARGLDRGLALVVDAAPAPVATSFVLPSFLKPGRLELAAVAGGLGAWAAVTGGILTATNADQYLLDIDPWLIVIGTGTSALALGVGGMAGGYLLADTLDIDQGNAWAFTAAMTWGTSYAIAMLPAIYDVTTPPWYLEDELDFGLPLLGGAVGAATGFALSLATDPEIAEVSMMNTGGWTAGVAGVLLGVNIVQWLEPEKPLLVGATSYVALKTAGLIAGLGAAKVMSLSWGETLLGDVGTTLGGLFLGSVAVAFIISPYAEPVMQAVLGKKDPDLFSKTSITLASTAVVAGGALGLLTTTIGLGAWHTMTGVRFIRDDVDLPFSLAPPSLAFVVDKNGDPAPHLSILSLTW